MHPIEQLRNNLSALGLAVSVAEHLLGVTNPTLMSWMREETKMPEAYLPTLAEANKILKNLRKKNPFPLDIIQIHVLALDMLILKAKKETP